MALSLRQIGKGKTALNLHSLGGEGEQAGGVGYRPMGCGVGEKCGWMYLHLEIPGGVRPGPDGPGRHRVGLRHSTIPTICLHITQRSLFCFDVLFRSFQRPLGLSDLLIVVDALFWSSVLIQWDAHHLHEGGVGQVRMVDTEQ